MVKNLNFLPNVDFDSSKEASWCTERNAKNHRSLPSIVTEKIKKNPQNVPKMDFFGKFEFFGGFFLIFSVCLRHRPSGAVFFRPLIGPQIT